MDLRVNIRIALLIIVALFVSGCSPDNVRSFDIRNLAKSDIDMVADSHRQELNKLIRQLTTKLYKRNPRELSKTPRMTVDLRVQQILAPPPSGGYPELQGRSGNDAMQLALTESYRGDRVFALMAGIRSMIDAAFGYKQEFFLLDELDQQKLYNSARNLETVAWQLNNRKNASGQPLLLANGISREGITNLSFERVLGKMIALQDMLATIIADTTDRNIKNVVHKAASLTFLPI
ncbi:hypothetical protein IOQ59_15860 [Pontibacterium sp. N1Y112]|uniref:Lipoprotein n=1 Tax=Pontibacterium sinense TaxID=2781979 RepID=A0A8J7K6N0_9GAMM|nr:hypothetical protein [Pontibacterium sinense]